MGSGGPPLEGMEYRRAMVLTKVDKAVKLVYKF